MKYIFFNSPVHGIGCKATVNIKKGDVVSYEPFFIYDENNRRGDNFKDYAWSGGILNPKQSGKQIIVNGLGFWCNDSDDYNLIYKHQKDSKYITFIANKFIKKGDELFVNYGSHWWENRGNKIQIETEKIVPKKPVISKDTNNSFPNSFSQMKFF
tara:strand:+ start:231 stop:695 length:465 start_codon:yes stop_codon:yes gene_type:complete